MERSRMTREYLGRGTEYVVWSLDGQAIKFSSSLFTPFPTHRLMGAGPGVLERVRRDMAVLEEYLGREYLVDARVRCFSGLWWIEQVNAKNLPPLSSHTINQQAREDLITVAERAKRMKQETGLSLDWLGLDFFRYLKDFLLSKDFWVLPNILVAQEGSPAVKVRDLGLIYSLRRPFIAKEEGTCPNRIETIPWGPITESVLKMVEKRSGIGLT